MQVSELMNRELISVAPENSVEQAVRLLRRRGIRHLLVMKRDRLVGIISDRDVKRALDPGQSRKKLLGIGGLYFLLEPILVEEIMTRDPVTIEPMTSINQAASIMVERRFGALPVVQNGRTVGIVTETDLLRYYASAGMERESKVRRTRKAPARRRKSA